MIPKGGKFLIVDISSFELLGLQEETHMCGGVK
jgi:hypothetical protein